MNSLRGLLRASNVYDEHQPLLKILQVCGLAPFIMRRRRPEVSRLPVAYFLIQTASLIYCLYDSKSNGNFNRMSKYTLTTLMYDVFGVIGIAHTILTLLLFLLRAGTSVRVWTTIEEMDSGAVATRSRLRNASKTVLFLLAFGYFVAATFNLQTNSSRLTATFWLVWYLPLFHKCLSDFAFHAYCSHLAGRFAASNASLAEDVAALRGGRLGTGALRRLRSVRENHFRGYRVILDVNSLFGVHFVFTFVCYFVNATLDLCNIVRLHKATSPTSVVRYLSSVYWTVIEVVQLLNIVLSGVLVTNEVRRMMPLLHEYLILIDDADSRLKRELQLFILQLEQCPIAFFAAGFFQIDSPLLLKMGAAVVSNAFFLIQIDKLKKRV